MRGVPLYSNLLAMEDADGWAIAVVNFPALDERVYAGRGLGCFQDHAGGRKLPARVAAAPDEGVAPFLMSSGYTHWDEAKLLAVKRAGWALRTWGDAYGYALVATGRAQAMVDPIAAEWDLAPMPLIIGEAGGTFTTVDGVAGDPAAGSGVATGGVDHEALLALLRA